MKKLLQLQNNIGSITKDKKNPFFNSWYFDINSLLSVVKPELKKLNILLYQTLTTVSGVPALKTVLIDLDNEEDEIIDTIILPNLQDPQKMGATITYYRRYAIQTLLLLEADDDDGNTASGKTKIPEQNKEIVDKNSLLKKQIAFILKKQKPELSSPDDYREFCSTLTGFDLIPSNYQDIYNFLINK